MPGSEHPTAVTTNLSDAAGGAGALDRPDALSGARSGTAGVHRFSRVPRWVHWTTAAVMGVCLASAAVLYLGPLSVLVGRRDLVETVHLWSGFALPVPVVAGWLSRSFRAEVRALNRFATTDWDWLRARIRPTFSRASAKRASEGTAATARSVGKFNAGQKLFAAFVAGSIAVMLGTGLLMQYGPGFDLRLAWRTGATFVHDWLAIAITITIAGHLWMAWRDPVARLGMRTGTVPAWWARQHHAAWIEGLARPGRKHGGKHDAQGRG
jgi:formate dehydrogenase subunit gamma